MLGRVERKRSFPRTDLHYCFPFFPVTCSYLSLTLVLTGGIPRPMAETSNTGWQKAALTDQEKQETSEHLPQEVKWKQPLRCAKNYVAALHPAPVTTWQQQPCWCWMQDSTRCDSERIHSLLQIILQLVFSWNLFSNTLNKQRWTWDNVLSLKNRRKMYKYAYHLLTATVYWGLT